MSSSSNIILAFDLYGTLLSTASVAQKLAEHVGEDKARNIAREWRSLQLEYSWRLTAMGKYKNFSSITMRSLRHALLDAGVSLLDHEIQGVLQAYNSLNTFPDVERGLQSLRSAEEITGVVFSNGSSEMVTASIQNSPSLSPHWSIFTQVVSVEDVKKFKPAPEVYHHLARSVGKSEQEMGDIWLVSSNPFDVVGARACNLKVVWVDRTGNGWIDSLTDEDGAPTVIVTSLEQVIEVVKAYVEDRTT